MSMIVWLVRVVKVAGKQVVQQVIVMVPRNHQWGAK